MAARRLLIIMLVLLGISTLAAALVPAPDERRASTGSDSSTTTSTSGEEPEATGSELVEETVEAEFTAKNPALVPVAPGDQLALTVVRQEAGEVSIPAFGVVEFAGPGNTASFDILVAKAGRYPVRQTGKGTIATIVARDEEPPPGDARRDG